jgi:hypothetical protein
MHGRSYTIPPTEENFLTLIQNKITSNSGILTGEQRAPSQNENNEMVPILDYRVLNQELFKKVSVSCNNNHNNLFNEDNVFTLAHAEDYSINN